MQYEIALTLSAKGETSYMAAVDEYLSFCGCENMKPLFMEFWNKTNYCAAAPCGSTLRYWDAEFSMDTDCVRGILISATDYLDTDDYLYLEVGHNEDDDEFSRAGFFWENPFESNFIRGIQFRKLGEHHAQKPNRPLRFPTRRKKTGKVAGLMRRDVTARALCRSQKRPF